MSYPRATQVLIPIELFDSTDPTMPETGLTFGASDTKIAADGGAFANTTNTPVEASNGLYWLTLTAAEMDATSIIVVVSKAGVQRASVTIGTHGMPSASVVASGGNTSSSFDTDRSESATDYWKDAFLTFTTGALAGQTKRVTAYDGTTKVITVANAFTGTPSTGDRFVLIDR